ncbi:serine/threonine-protein kinase RsbW [Lipingzhangella halophila]|uniref:Serine/threonine-protein kinase RsbW n=1 Tax=Lipingzhangella halophila TaxID=1783352 RepID=A0A7W7RLN7_9ACTN|nr:ATP-binding protein [Lipingzhangella halophila]MBB4934277.1 serine/threonine-protein kinase RsbW [Lipingzhangella halophila]
MGVKFSIVVPRRAYTVGIVRRILAEALSVNGVCGDCGFSILLTLSEACTNAVEHGAPATEYEVTAEVNDDSCLLEIADTGPAFNPDQVSLPDTESESGRGILLMRRLADEVRFRPSPVGGTAVRLRKLLHNGGSHDGLGCGIDARTPAMLC